MQVLDKWDKLMAWRHVPISEANRCFCVWNRECVCTTIEDQLFASDFKTISQKDYNSAGFRGAKPEMHNFNSISKLNIIKLIFFFLSTFFIMKFLIGTIHKMYEHT